jgi:hypothetical protein
MKNRIAIFLAIAAIAWSNRRSPLLEAGGVEILVCAVLLVVCVYPAVRWLRRPQKSLPVFELYCLMHVVYYLQPYIDGKPSLQAFPESVRVLAGMVTIVFLASAIFIFVLRDREGAPAGRSHWLMRREIPAEYDSWFWMALGLWLAYNVAATAGVFPDVGDWLNVIATISTAAGTLATYHFFHAIGSERFSRGATLAAIAALAIGVLVTFSSGYLIAGTMFIIVALVAYTVAARRLPVVTAVVCLAFVNFLHLGKADMRVRFWNRSDVSAGANNPLVVLSFWIDASWIRLAEGSTSEGGERTSLVTRASLAQMLATVVDQTPDRLPYLAGETFWQIPILFVPRVILPDKPKGNLPSETMAIYYGIQTNESVKSTSIGLGQIAEAWANYGWIGIVVVGCFYGWLFFLPCGLTKSLEPNTLGYLLSAVSLAWATDLEHALGTFLVSLTQTVALAGVLLYFMSRPARQPPRRHAPARATATA